MSRVGAKPIVIPANVSVQTEGSNLVVKGPLGELNLDLLPEVKVVVESQPRSDQGQQLKVQRKRNDRFSRSVHGLTRSLIANMVKGVSEGWEKSLELVGVGFRAQTVGENLILSVGYSHPVEIKAPVGIKFSVMENTKITVSGFNRELVGEVAAKIREVKPPEPYQGKGVRYSGEYVRRKAGKAGKVGAGLGAK